MSFFPRFVTNEFAPMFRLMDDYASHVAIRSGPQFTCSLRSFQPKFDVKETKTSYELHGELPGIDQKDIDIEFTDNQTLSIKGHTEQFREEGTRPAGFLEGGQGEQSKIAESERSATPESNYHKPTVEDDSGNVSINAPETPNHDAQVAQPQKQSPSTSRYWVSERSIGDFARTFAFPDRVDQDNVKASLKNGILNIVIPKAAAPVARRITVE
ncbi:hypothetical protein MBLNU230_g8645t1 [Neophaeotheca triangularis]